jgi:hypothetical protein
MPVNRPFVEWAPDCRCHRQEEIKEEMALTIGYKEEIEEKMEENFLQGIFFSKYDGASDEMAPCPYPAVLKGACVCVSLCTCAAVCVCVCVCVRVCVCAARRCAHWTRRTRSGPTRGATA